MSATAEQHKQTSLLDWDAHKNILFNALATSVSIVVALEYARIVRHSQSPAAQVAISFLSLVFVFYALYVVIGWHP